MTILFPRALPAALTTDTQAFFLEPNLELSAFRSGEQAAKDLGEALWRMRVQTPPRSEDDLAELAAWYHSITSVQPFYGYDVLRRWPRGYKSGWGALTVAGVPFNGTGQIASVTNAKSLGLKTLPVGFGLLPGDYLHFDYGAAPSRALHQVVEGGTAAGGGTLTVEVRPFIRAGWSVNAVVTLFQPSAKMYVTPDTWSVAGARNRTGVVSFEALQTLG